MSGFKNNFDIDGSKAEGGVKNMRCGIQVKGGLKKNDEWMELHKIYIRKYKIR